MDDAVVSGTFAEIEFTARTLDGKIFETTGKEEAETAGIAGGKFGPMLVIAGKGQVIRGVDEAIMGMREGEKKEVEIPPEKAFGSRNEELVRVVPLKDFQKNGIKPVAGLLVQLDGRNARVQSVNAGRVRVDLNNPLAGQGVKYEIRIARIIGDEDEKVRAIVRDYFNGFETKVDVETATIRVGPEARKDADYVFQKAMAVGKILEFTKIKRVRVEEEYAKR